MLLEFVVKNFKSIQTEQRLSLVAAPDKTLAESHLIQTGIPSIPYALRTVAIYGANASGKSNVIQAMAQMQQLARTSASMGPEQKLPYNPFKLDADSAREPSLFEVTVSLNGVRYQYGFSQTADRIVEEWLLVYEKRRAQTWFSREWNESLGEDFYEFSSFFRGQKETWKKATRRNALFLTTAVQLNSDQLKPLFEWIVSRWIIGFAQMPPFDPASVGQRLQDGSWRMKVLNFLNTADLSIKQINTHKEKINVINFQLDPNPAKSSAATTQLEINMPDFIHKTARGDEVVFPFTDESQGTIRMLSLASPLLDVLTNGSTLVVDELETSLHPLLVKYIMGHFNSSKDNPRGAQLVFSTHSTSLLEREVLRRDEVWFTEKNLSSATELFPLSDFSPRKQEALEHNYLAGRYGAIPVLSQIRSFTDAGKNEPP